MVGLDGHPLGIGHCGDTGCFRTRRSSARPGNIACVPRVTRDEARAIARAECEDRQWPWQEPVHEAGRLFTYRFMTNAQQLGGNVTIRVRARDGKVLSAGFARR